MADFHAYHSKFGSLADSVMTAVDTQTKTINMRFQQVQDQLEGIHAFVRWQAAMMEKMTQQADAAATMNAKCFALIGAKLDTSSAALTLEDIAGLAGSLAEDSTPQQPVEQPEPPLQVHAEPPALETFEEEGGIFEIVEGETETATVLVEEAPVESAPELPNEGSSGVSEVEVDPTPETMEEEKPKTADLAPEATAEERPKTAASRRRARRT